MPPSVADYIASGYFLSRYAAAQDRTGLQLRRISMGHDHSQRRFFPETWALSWCRETREQRIKEAAVFGLSEEQLDKAIAWADAGFGSVFGAWDVFYSLEGARSAARSFLSNAVDLDLWGVGLHRSLVRAFCEDTEPGPPQPWGVPGRGAVDTMTCVRPTLLAEGGTVLGHEVVHRAPKDRNSIPSASTPYSPEDRRVSPSDPASSSPVEPTSLAGSARHVFSGAMAVSLAQPARATTAPAPPNPRAAPPGRC